MKSNWHIPALFYVAGYLPKWSGLCFILLLIVVWNRRLIHYPFLLVTSITFFIISSLTSPSTTIPQDDYGHYEGDILIKSNPDYSEGRTIFTGETDFASINITLNDSPSYFHHGSQCQFKGLVEVPNPPTNSGQFNYRSFLANQGISYVSYDAEIVDCEGRSIVSHVYQLRETISERLMNTVREDTFIWINALFLGERNGIPKEILETFQFWGLSHLLAISGLHVGILLGLCYFIFNNVFYLTKQQSKLIMLVIIPIYMFLAGAQPPVIRAGLMALLVIVGSFFRRYRVETTDLISLVFIGLLVVDPYLLYQLSFQFSFAVTFALILSKNLLVDRNWIMVSLIVSLISQLIILPLQFYYFYYTNVLSFVMNLIFVPYFTLVVIPLLMFILISVWVLPSIIPLVESVFQFIHHHMMSLILSSGQPEYAQWIVGQPDYILMLAYCLIFIFFMHSWEQHQIKRASFLTISLVCIWFLPSLKSYLNDELSVTMLDVGQAESIVIELPHNQGVYVIDVGEEMLQQREDHQNFNRIIKPYLWSRGIAKVDGLIISHFDYDHSASLQPFVTQFNPTTVFTHPYITINHVNHKPLQKGMTLKKGDFTIKVVSPDLLLRDAEENDRSLVLLVTIHDLKMLFTGDVTSNVETNLVKQQLLQDIDVLKIAHHGSNTSTSELLLEALKPEIALISVGEHNRYGHPNPTVLSRLSDADIDIYRTDLNGAITLKYADGQSTIVPYIP